MTSPKRYCCFFQQSLPPFIPISRIHQLKEKKRIVSTNLHNPLYTPRRNPSTLPAALRMYTRFTHQAFSKKMSVGASSPAVLNDEEKATYSRRNNTRSKNIYIQSPSALPPQFFASHSSHYPPGHIRPLRSSVRFPTFDLTSEVESVRTKISTFLPTLSFECARMMRLRVARG